MTMSRFWGGAACRRFAQLFVGGIAGVTDRDRRAGHVGVQQDRRSRLQLGPRRDREDQSQRQTR